MELSIVLVVVGMMAGMTLKVNTTKINEKNVYDVDDRIELVERRLLDYRKAYNRLPCPANPALALSHADAGKEVGDAGNCGVTGSGVAYGALPTKVLDLPDDASLDTWKRKFTYVVDIRITENDAFNTYPIDDTDIGAIIIKDASTYNRTTKGVSAVISHGPNGHGAYMPNGTRVDADSINVSEWDNCNCDANLGATPSPSGDSAIVQKTSTLNSANPADSFDDIARYKLRLHYKGEADLVVDEEEDPTNPDEVEVSFGVYWDSVQRFIYNKATNTISAPLVTPGGVCSSGNGSYHKEVIYSADNTYLVCTGGADAPGDSSTLTIFKRTGNAANVLPNALHVSPDPVNLQPAVAGFSSNDRYLAVGSMNAATLPYLRVYKRTGDNFAKISDANFSELPSTAVGALGFSPDGVYLAVAAGPDPRVRIYKRKGDTFTRIAFDASTVNGYGINKLEFDNTNTYLAVAFSGGVALYKRNGDTFTQTSVNWIGTNTFDGAWSPDSNYFVAGQSHAPWINLFKRNGDSLTPIALPSPAPATIGSFDFTPDSNYLVIGYYGMGAPNNAAIYKRNGDAFTSVLTFDIATTWNRFTSFVNADSTLATITSVTPPINGTYTTGQNLDFTVNFNKAVSVSGTPAIDIQIGSVWQKATYVSGSGTSSLRFRYIVQLGDNDSDGIEVKDPINRNGNGAIESGNHTARLFFDDVDTHLVFIRTTPPTITSVTPPANATYTAGQNLDFIVNYDEVVMVSGVPRIQMTVGSTTRYADYLSGAGTANLTFRYTIQSGDADANGIQLISPIEKNGGIIQNGIPTEALYTFAPPDTSGILVGSGVPVITFVAPPGNGVYLHNQYLTFNFTFSEPVNVTGTPRLQLTIGSLTRYADYVSGSGTSVLTFRYLLNSASDEEDLDGITMISPLEANGGTVKSVATTNDANLTFTVPNTTGVLVDFDATYSGTDMVIGTSASQLLNLDIDYTTDTATSIIPASDVAPGQYVNSASFSSDNTYVATGHGFFAGTKMHIYKRSGTTLTKLANPAVIPASEVQDVSFSPDTNYLAVGSWTAGDPLHVYKRSGDTFTRLDPNANFSPAMDTSHAVLSVAWSKDSTYLAVGRYNTSPALRVYKRSGDTFTQLTNPPSQPGFGVNQCDWSHNNVYLACAASWQGLINIWKRSGDSFTVNTSQPAIDFHANSVAFSHDSNFLAVGMSNAPFIRIFTRSGDTFNLVAGQPAAAPPGVVQAVAWNHDSSYLYAGSPSNANYGYIYKRGGTMGAPTFAPIAFTLVNGARRADFRNSNGYVAPVITDFTVPADGIYYTGQNMDFGVTFDKDVTVSGTPRISISIGSSTVYATYTGGSGSKILTFRYSVVTSDKDYDGISYGTDVQENGGSIKDAGNNVNADLTMPYMSGVGVLINAQYEVSVASNNTPFVTMYDLDRTTDTLIKMPNLTGGLPPNQTFGVHYSPDNTYLASISGNAPRLQIYKLTNGYYSKLPNPAVLPNNQGHFARFSKTNTYLGVGFVGANGFYMYKRSGDTFTQIAFPALPGSRSAIGGTWSSDDTYFALGMTDAAGSNDLAIYKRSGDTFTELATPAYTPVGGQQFNGGTFSNDDTYLMMPLNWNGVVMFKRSGDTFTQIASPPSLPSIFCGGGSWSSDATYVAIPCWSTSPYLAIYKRTGDTFNKLADPATVPTGNGTGAVFSPDDAYLAVTSHASPYVIVYKRSGDTFTKIANPATLPAGAGNGVAWRNSVSSVTISSVSPPANGSYSAGQNLDFTVNFTEAVNVTGTPRIALTIGSTTRYATYQSGTGTSSLVFRHTVQAGDSDMNGIAMISPLELNAGTIKNAGGADAILSYTPPNTAGVLIDASGPSVLSVTPPANAWYVNTQNMDFIVSFSENVVVTGTPRIALTIGAATRYATYINGSGTSTLYFRYEVQTGDIDTNGIDIVSPLELNGGTLKDTANNNSTLTFVPPATPNVKVDAVLATITSVTPPANGGYRLDQNLDFIVNFDEAINVTGTPRIQLTVGSTTRYADYYSGSGTANLTFRHTVVSGDYDINGIQTTSPIDLNGGHLRDLATNDALLTFTPPNTASVNVDAQILLDIAVSVNANNDQSLHLYKIDWTNDIFTTAANPPPADLPSGFGNRIYGVDWSYDSLYLAAGLYQNSGGGDVASIFKRSGTTLSKVAGLGSFTDVDNYSISFSNDSLYLLTVGMRVPPGYDYSKMRMFKRSGDTFSEMANQPQLPKIPASAHYVRKAQFSPDGTLAALALAGTNPNMLFFRRSGDKLVPVGKIKGLGNAPLTYRPFVFSENNDYLIANGSTSPYVYIFKRKGNMFYRLPNLDVLPPSTAVDIAISPDSNYLAVSLGAVSPYLKIYKRSGDNFNALTDLSDYTYNERMAFSADGKYLLTSANGFKAYKRTGDTFTNIGSLPALSNNQVNGFDMRQNLTTLTKPEDKNYGTGENLDFKVNFFENVNVTGAPRLTLNVGGVTRYADYNSGTGTSQFIFRYTAQAGDVDDDGIQVTNSIDLNGGTIRNAATSNANITFATVDTRTVKINPPATFDLSTLTGTNGFRIDGNAASDRLGRVGNAGDLNGDGIADLVVSTPSVPGGSFNEGAIYVLFGKSTGWSTPIAVSSIDGTNGFRLTGVATDDNAGSLATSAGDVNGDGYGDLMVTAPFTDPAGFNSGTVYIIFGKASGWAASMSLSALDGTNGFRVTGTGAMGNLQGHASGDINGDGYSDILLGSAQFGLGNPGYGYLVFGKAAGWAASLAVTALDGTNGFRLDGVNVDDWTGGGGAMGDINGDGLEDMILGASLADPGGNGSAGSIYVVFGKTTAWGATFALSTLDGTTGFRLDGAGANHNLGYLNPLKMDFNGDGYDDIIAAAPGANGAMGYVYVILGKASGWAASAGIATLADGTSGTRIDGVVVTGSLSSLSSGDINGDGYADVLLGESSFASAKTHVIYGRPTFAGASLALSALDGINGFSMSSIVAGDAAGNISFTGDINVDGINDFIVGAQQADPGGNANAGSAYIVFGK